MSDEFDTPAAAQEPKRDRWGRYLLPDPESGKEKAWTRATTWASTVADTYGLTQWQLRMVAKGIAMRRDLYALAAATPVEDRKTFDRLVNDAKEAAAASSGANLGTALHAFTERVDRGEVVDAPDPWQADVDAYRAAMVTNKVTVHRQWIERITIVRDLSVAGTFDRIVTVDGVNLIADVKTGKDLAYSWGEIAIQLAIYAHADAIWNDRTGTYEPMPDVDRSRAIVMHLPVGQGWCQLHEVDITAGWEMARTCATVRDWRKRRDLAAPLGQVTVGDPLAKVRERSNTLGARITAAASVADLEALWVANATTWTPVHTAAAAARKKALLSTGQG